MRFETVEQVRAHYAAIPPPPSILEELQATDDPIQKGFIMLRSIRDYMDSFAVGGNQ